MLVPGNRAPDFTLEIANRPGEVFSLYETLRGGHPVLLVFLRHLG